MSVRGIDSGSEARTTIPSWLRPLAAGCGLVTVLLVLLLVGGLMAPSKVLRLGVVAIRQRTLKALPPNTPKLERERLENAFQCVLAAVATGRLSQDQITPLGAVSARALHDRQLTADEVSTVTATAEQLCRLAGGAGR